MCVILLLTTQCEYEMDSLSLGKRSYLHCTASNTCVSIAELHIQPANFIFSPRGWGAVMCSYPVFYGGKSAINQLRAVIST